MTKTSINSIKLSKALKSRFKAVKRLYGEILKSTQYKKVEPNALWFTYQNLKSCKPHKKQNKKLQNAKSTVKKLKIKGLIFFAPFFSCDLQDFKF